MFGLIVLLGSMKFAAAEDFRTEILAVQSRTASAMVRVHAQGYVHVALCPINNAPDLWKAYLSVESLYGCKASRKVRDTAENAAAIAAALMQTAKTQVETNVSSKKLLLYALRSTAVGTVAGLAAYSILSPGVAKIAKIGTTEGWRFGLGAAVGFATSAGLTVANGNHLNHLLDASIATVSFARSWTAEPAPFLLIVNERTWVTLFETLDTVFAAVEASVVRP